ncbi:apoptosis regulator BAX-like isoform X2 [Grus americana]|uniref:apoptosis regulator BAX-like isoform X2 n=1 Tax=Grus americana TaxID=9117 RepID=UPI0024084522|nr:apoptosis regulator BAX-like isoform X2 [Grus americana]
MSLCHPALPHPMARGGGTRGTGHPAGPVGPGVQDGGTGEWGAPGDPMGGRHREYLLHRADRGRPAPGDTGLPRRVPPQELGGEVEDETAVSSLCAAVLCIWGHLSQDPEMDSLVGALAGCPPLPALAGVSEQLFQDGINWGRVVVFFYFTYRVVRQALWGDHPVRTILDWAVSFLQRHLSAWIQRQGGWGSILSYSPLQPPRAMGSPEK